MTHNIYLFCFTDPHFIKKVGISPEYCKLFSTNDKYRSGTVNSKSLVGKVLLRIKWKFELN